MTNLSTTKIDALTAILTGTETKRANSKDATIARFTKAAAAKGINQEAIDAILAADDAAQNVLAGYLAAQAAPKVDHSASNALIAKAMAADPEMIAPARRKAALTLVVATAPEAKPARKPRAAKAEAAPKVGKRAEIMEAAKSGKLPAAPDFSAETHKRFRAKLAQIVAAAEAGDIKALRAFEINPVSSSPKAMAKYRDLAVIALESRTGKTAAA
jgi:hypothetical protein